MNNRHLSLPGFELRIQCFDSNHEAHHYEVLCILNILSISHMHLISCFSLMGFMITVKNLFIFLVNYPECV